MLLRDVAGQSARLSCGTDDRLRFLDAACNIAGVTAKLGKSVARVRAANGGQMEENRQRIIVERVERSPVLNITQGEGGS